MGDGNKVGGQVYWLPEVNGGGLGVPTPTPGSLCKINGLLWRGSEAKVVVEAKNDLGDTIKHVGGGSTGEATKRAGWGRVSSW